MVAGRFGSAVFRAYAKNKVVLLWLIISTMNNLPPRKRDTILTQTSNYSTEYVSDSEWKRVLSRRQNCKERMNKIRDGIDYATDKIKQLDDLNKSIRNERQERNYGGQPINENGILHTINPNSFISSQPIENGYTVSQVCNPQVESLRHLLSN